MLRLRVSIILVGLFAPSCCYQYEGISLGDFTNAPPFDNTPFLPQPPSVIQDDFNVFCLDWKNGANGAYEQAVANARVVGAVAAAFIEHLSADGLDPAGPNFQDTDRAVRLDQTDAAFVDVIHTDGLKPIKNFAGLGILQKSGHADFYVNGGLDQPGCRSRISQILTDLVIGDLLPDDVVEALNCDHARSREYFIESINQSGCDFTGIRCNILPGAPIVFAKTFCRTCFASGCRSSIGFNADQNQAVANYFVETNGESPFCKG